MISKIIGATIVPTLQSLEWADQIAWMVKSWTKKVRTGEEQFADRIIPVAENTTDPDCHQNDAGLKEIGTDQAYTSLIMISKDGDMTSSIAANIPKRAALNIEQDISIAVWMNDHQGANHIAKADLIRNFYRKTYNQVKVEWLVDGVPDSNYDIFVNKLRVTFVREIEGNPFSEFAFASDQAQFHNKYSAFGMVFKLTGLIFPNCVPAFPELDHACGAANYVVDQSYNKIVG